MRSARVGLRPAMWAAVVGVALATGTGFGASGTFTLVRDFSNYTGVYNGGEFGITQFDGPAIGPMGSGVVAPGNLFQTFCLERNEILIGSGNWDLSTSAKLGGLAGQTSPGEDPLSPETAYIYSAFCDGTLLGYDYTFGGGRCGSADQLQWAIWLLEEEVYPNQLPLPAFAQAIGWYDEAKAAVASGAWSGLGGVGVLNMTDASGVVRQDVLFPGGGEPPPPPPPPGGGGHTPGFWGNKNGLALIGSDDLSALKALHLCNAKGAAFDPSKASAFQSWLANADATNMSYMLSAHLASMKLNVLNGFVNAGALVYAPGCGNTGPGNDRISIADLIAAADAALAADSKTPSGDANRAYQECLKDALDNANNNLNWVP